MNTFSRLAALVATGLTLAACGTTGSLSPTLSGYQPPVVLEVDKNLKNPEREIGRVAIPGQISTFSAHYASALEKAWGWQKAGRNPCKPGIEALVVVVGSASLPPTIPLIACWEMDTGYLNVIEGFYNNDRSFRYHNRHDPRVRRLVLTAWGTASFEEVPADYDALARDWTRRPFAPGLCAKPFAPLARATPAGGTQPQIGCVWPG